MATREEQLASLSPEMRAKFEKLTELRRQAEAEEEEHRRLVAAISTIVLRIVERDPALADDPIVIASLEALNGDEQWAKYKTMLDAMGREPMPRPKVVR